MSSLGANHRLVAILNPFQREWCYIEITATWDALRIFFLRKTRRGLAKEHQLFEPVENKA